MVKTALVREEIERGAELLETLDRANVKVDVALWAFLAEYEDWRIVVAARQFDTLEFRKAHRLLNESLERAGFTPDTTPFIMLLQMSDPFIKELRRRYGKFKDIHGMRPAFQSIGDRFLEDSYVYRIS